ncbi:WhiB family transcriptional regulator [Mycolicibacterium sp. YH-1]|uniref:WhiB family transcriptional regulator n=1 Tax=Mycolicibacterium sp. YH-1 TaxID=2908837 RepID=UPI001F4BFBDF|nr:WhiB family transcriptional regulator [Mycolicibacterium sp. YH-1]UNB52961.1 WhiB family transcriptional regulator [Mycolicibacterium sp. YH-1]
MWRKHARCRTEDPGLFSHPDGERGHARARRQQQARQVCAQCPVTRQCGEHSIAFQEAFGIWGGLTEADRTTLLASSAVHIRTHRRSDQTDSTPRNR